MSIAHKIKSLLIAVMFSSTSLGMIESKEPQSMLPDPLLRIIFGCGGIRDLERSSAVSRQWKKCAHDERKTTMGLRVLKMATWEKEDLEYMISDERFSQFDNYLLENKIIARTRQPFKKDPLVMFLAYNMLDVSFAWKVARDVANFAASASGGKNAGDAAVSAAVITAEAAAEAAARAALGALARAATSGAIAEANGRAALWYSAVADAWEAAEDGVGAAAKMLAVAAVRVAVIKSLKVLDIKENSQIGLAAWRLSTLYFKAFSAQSEYSKNFDDAFSTLEEMLREREFSMSIDELLNIIGRPTWNNAENPELATNPYLLKLKYILETLAQKYPVALN